MAFRDRLFEGIEAWNRGDIDFSVGRTHPDVVWETSGLFAGLDRQYRGKEGVRRFMTQIIFFRTFPEWEDCVAAASDPTFGPGETERAHG